MRSSPPPAGEVGRRDPIKVGPLLPMKHHAYATQMATQWKRPPKLNVRQRKRCIHPPRDGKEVKPPPAYDFVAAVEASPLINHWRPCREGFNIGPAFQ